MMAVNEDFAAATDLLNKALDRARRRYRHSSDGGRQGTILALAAVADFVRSVAPPCGRKYDLFHMVLLAALSDLGKGVVVPMLTPKSTGRGRRRDIDNFGHTRIKLQAAATMASLMDIGFGRDDASHKVADVLQRCGLRLGEGHNLTGGAIADWYDDNHPANMKRKGRPRKKVERPCNSDDRRFSDDRVFYVAGTNEIIADLASKGRPRDDIRDALGEELASVVRLWAPAPEQRAVAEKLRKAVHR